MTTTVEIEQVPIDVTADVTRAREVVDEARHDAHTALVAHSRLLTIETLAAQVTRIEGEIKTARDEWTDWIRDAVETSQEVADEQDWCGVYDAAMERLGLPPRPPKEEDIEWHCDVDMSLTVDDDEIIRLVRNENGYGVSGIEVSQSAEVSASVRVEGTYTGTGCICDQIDSDEIENNLPSEFSDWTIEDRGTVYCDHD
jgi:hypothetical protein